MIKADKSAWRYYALAIATVVAALSALLLPAMPQPLDYHRFADCQPLFGIANGLNVLSNLPVLAIGVIGLRFVSDLQSNGARKPAMSRYEQPASY